MRYIGIELSISRFGKNLIRVSLLVMTERILPGVFFERKRFHPDSQNQVKSGFYAGLLKKRPPSKWFDGAKGLWNY